MVFVYVCFVPSCALRMPYAQPTVLWLHDPGESEMMLVLGPAKAVALGTPPVARWVSVLARVLSGWD